MHGNLGFASYLELATFYPKPKVAQSCTSAPAPPPPPPHQRQAPTNRKSGPPATAIAPKHFSSNSTAPAAPHPATFCLFVRSTLLSVVNMADISTLSKLLEASLDPRQNKQGRSLSLFLCVFTLSCCPALPLAACIEAPNTTLTQSQPSRPSPRSRGSPTSRSPSSRSSPPTRTPPQYGWRAPSTSRTSSSATGSTRMATTSCRRTRWWPSSVS